MTNKLIDDIWRHIEPSVKGYSRVIQICLAAMTEKQLEGILEQLSDNYPMTQEQIAAVVNSLSKVLRDAGKHLSETEYADFVFDVLLELEYKETGRINAA
jgi:uncharacterized protein YwlG (UPF0340 family)